MDSIINPLESYLISKTTSRKEEKVICGTVARIYFASSVRKKWENKKAGYLIILKSKLVSNNFKLRLISFDDFEIINESEILPNSKLDKLSQNFYSLACQVTFKRNF